MYFFEYGVERTFSTFDLVHLSVLFVSFFILGFMIVRREKLYHLEKRDLYGYILGGFLLFLDFSFYIWKWINGEQKYFPMPMHLCSWATYLVAISLFLKNEKLFQVSLYYGVTGGLLSLLVPEFGGYSFDHMRFYQFFLLHLIIIIGPLYQYFVYSFKLEKKYLIVTIIIMWIQAFIAFGVNNYVGYLTGTRGNGMFVYEPPVALPGLLGQTPFYLIGFTGIFLVLWYGVFVGLTKLKKN